MQKEKKGNSFDDNTHARALVGYLLPKKFFPTSEKTGYGSHFVSITAGQDHVGRAT